MEKKSFWNTVGSSALVRKLFVPDITVFGVKYFESLFSC